MYMPPERPLVLHISGEYPDPVRNRTTPAVKSFIDRLPEFDHLIVSIRRQSDPRRCYVEGFEDGPHRRVVAIGYWAPPAGVLHRWRMRRLARDIEAVLARLGRRPVVTTAHKLTIEGVVAYRLRQRLGIPYICCVRGEVEDKFFRFKPELAPLFGNVIAEAEALYFVSAWFRKRIEARYPGRMRAHSLLPNFVADRPAPPLREPEPNTLLSVMDLNVYRRKGLPDLLRALARARQVNPALRLDVIGWTSPELTAEVTRLAARAGVESSVRFLGFKPNAEVVRSLPGYAGFVLPARNETFGMAYVEALMAGVPILYGSNSGIDGYLDGLEAGITVPLGDDAKLADGLLELIRRGPELREGLRSHHAELRRRFALDSYLDHYRAQVRRLAMHRQTDGPVGSASRAVSLRPSPEGPAIDEL
ncbi:glycosyltransferase family 4 protein [Desertibaculum subflavum]|uniref:glycosyltransferase family 4 protein n=1 Tax=Desertibaculum subflavum TaxID=2268458 RepID=UPI0013C4DEB1